DFRMRALIILPILTLATLACFELSFAHEGEDHDRGSAAPVALVAAPRLEAASDNFELVAVADKAGLTIYVDRLRTNAPVGNAAITVETPSGSISAAAEPDGTYRLSAPWAAVPGRYPLIFTIESEGSA